MVLACLVDVYDTLLTCDFRVQDRVLSDLAGIPCDTWREALSHTHVVSGVGQVTRAEMYEIVLRTCGVKPREELVRELVATDLELLLANGRLFDDALPFLEQLRSRGIATAIVSNCGEFTRDLLNSRGVIALTDVAVLSCEVGVIKPSPRIFRYALAALRANPADTVFVDDQPAFCAAAETVGVHGIRIVRDGGPPPGPPPPGTVRSLLDVLDVLDVPA
jgi:HAD superfamily hydrolase (TIGR01509 family)